MKQIIRWGLAGTMVLLIGIWLPGSADDNGKEGRRTFRARGQPLVPPAADHRVKFQQIVARADDTRREGDLRELAGCWVKANPENALKFAVELPPGEVRDSFVRHLLGAWGKCAAAAALQWSDQRPDHSDRRDTRETICMAVAESDPRLALGLAIRHGSEGDDSAGLLENLSAQWADREPEAALDWVMAQPDGEWRDRLMARVAFVLSKSDPHSAACRVAGEMEPGPAQTEAILSVLHQWTAVDPGAAADWVRDFPPGSLRDRALGELAGGQSSQVRAVE